MGYHEENKIHKSDFFAAISKTESLQRLSSKRPEPVLEPMGMYETLPGHDIVDDDEFFEAFGPFEGKQFRTYLKGMRQFGEKIRLELKENKHSPK